MGEDCWPQNKMKPKMKQKQNKNTKTIGSIESLNTHGMEKINFTFTSLLAYATNLVDYT